MACLRVTLKARSAFIRTVRHYSTPVFSQEVQSAKRDSKPIVALESTIITHGMPYPANLETARQVENIIRDHGAVPATIAILKGQLTIGLTQEQLEYLAQAKDVIKASRRDLAKVVADQRDGAATVAGTIIAAELAEIPVFVTGGIGGVHRDGENTLDVSADLTELGRCKTLVVCSGVKSILDIGKTLEYLETQGVTVCVFGPSKQFPAFYTRQSGHDAPYNVENAEQAAKILQAARVLQLSSGIVVAVPVPEEDAMDEHVIERAISNALYEAEKRHIKGKEITPFLLAEVSKATGGAALKTNIALIKNNARVGAEIAIQYQKLRGLSNGKSQLNISSRNLHTSCIRQRNVESSDEGDVLVIGGANVDRSYRITEDSVQLDGSTHACSTYESGGGVGRNIAEGLWRLRNGRTKLLTAVGDDADGRYLQNIAPGLILEDCITTKARTATYAAMFDKKGECLMGLGDMEIHNYISVDLVDKHINLLKNSPLVVVDGNIPQNTMDHILELCQLYEKPVFFEPTDRRKSIKPFRKFRSQIAFASPNLPELKEMALFFKPELQSQENKIDYFSEIVNLTKIVSNHVHCLIITLGSNGVALATRDNTNLSIRLFPTEKIHSVENVSGAGDCFTTGFIYGTLLKLKEAESVSIGFNCAKTSLKCKTTVPSDFSECDKFCSIDYHTYSYDNC